MAEVIWPGGVDIGTGAVLRGSAECYRVLPSLDRPRLLVPAGSPRAAAAVLRYSAEATGRRAVLRRRLLATAFRVGIAGAVLRNGVAVREPERGLGSRLSTVLGTRAVLGVRLGPARANRKPVATVLRPDGGLLGYAKVGVNPLTGALVDTEARALARLAGIDLGRVTIPAVLHHGGWNGNPLLVQEPLPVWLPRAVRRVDAERAAMVSVARCLGTRVIPYDGSAYSDRLSAHVRDLDADEDTRRLSAVLDTVTGAGPVLEFGAWHGDWNGGNSAVLADGRVLVWDWERFDPDVPVGFDAVHLAVQDAITRRGTAPRQAAADVLSAAPALLAPFGVTTAAASTVAVLYLVEIAARYLRDRQAEAGAWLGRVAQWLLPAVEEHLALVGAPGRGV
jgi:hypothetical protein